MNQTDETSKNISEPEAELANDFHLNARGIGLHQLLRWVGTLATIGLLIYLLSQQGWGEIRDAFQQIPRWRLAVAVGIILLSRLAVGVRWHTLMRAAQIPITLKQSVQITFAGLFASNFLPTTVGGDVVRLAMALQLGFDRVICAASIVVDRLVGMAGMATAIPLGLPPLIGANLQSTVSSSGLAFIKLLPLPKRVKDRGRQIFQRLLQSSALWVKRPQGLLASYASTLLHSACLFGIVWILLIGMGEQISFWLASGLWSFTYFVTLLPVSINGYGVQEVAMTFLFSNFGGVSDQSSLTAALLVRTLQMFASLPGAVFLPDILSRLKSPRNHEVD